MIDRAWKKWTIGAGALVVAMVLGALLWADLQLRRTAGEFTRVVDRTAFAQAPERIAIVDVDVLAPDGRAMLPDRTVLVDRGRIASVSASGPVPAGTRVIDGEGRFLVPGFIDTHVHLRHSPNDLLLYLANGVTSIAEMSGEAHHLAWRRQTERGAPGPRMFIASRKLGNWDAFGGWFQAWTRHRINVGSADRAREVVAGLKADGYDAVKLGSFVDRDTYLALGEAAPEAGLRLLGHIPLEVKLDDVFASSQGEVAHVEELVKALQIEFGGFSGRPEAFLDFVRERSPDIADKLRARGIAVSTTVWLIDSLPRQKLELPALLGKIALPYANPGMVEHTRLSPGWLPGHNPYGRDEPTGSPEGRAAVRAYWTTYAEAHHIVLRALLDRGVRVIAGTDTDNAGVVPGFAMHDEMQALVDAGASNAQSLRAATATAGEWLGNDTGRIVPGLRADLVLLDGNPLEDIANSRRIDTVIVGGRAFERAQLDRMLDAVKTANDASRRDPLPGHGTGSASRPGRG